MAIRITSDSTCDLGNLVKERNIGIMAIQIVLDTKAYRDGVDITPEDIFKFVEETKMLPKTSAPSMTENTTPPAPLPVRLTCLFMSLLGRARATATERTSKSWAQSLRAATTPQAATTTSPPTTRTAFGSFTP
jgi:hypothetical protein